VITKAVTEPPSPPPIGEESIHRTLKRKIKEIGSILGRFAKEEYPAQPYIYDVVWKEIEGLPRPCHVFEVQDKGAVDGALAKLQHARDIWKPKLFLVVTGEKDRKKVDLLLKPFLDGTFHGISKDTIVLTAETVDDIYKGLTAHKEVIKDLLEV
jgi:putative lipoic acid-binding regulatory protein